MAAHYRNAYRFALGLSGNHNDACDLTQQAFYIAHQRLHQVREPAKQKQWLFTVLYREFLRSRRRGAAHPQTTLEFSERELPRIHVDHAASLDGEAVLLALQGLEENFRMPVALFYLNQVSYKEIAVTLDIPVGTVMSRLSPGKQMLRRFMEEGSSVVDSKIVPLRQPRTKGGIDG